MQLRRLDPGEASVGAHSITAVDADGTVVARYECPCHWCLLWRAYLPTMAEALREYEPPILGWLESQVH